MPQAGALIIKPDTDPATPQGVAGALLESLPAGGPELPRRFLLSCAHVLSPTQRQRPATPIEVFAADGLRLSHSAMSADPLSGGVDIGIAELEIPVDPAIPGIGLPTGANPMLGDDEDFGPGQGAPLKLFSARLGRIIATRLVKRDAPASIRHIDPAGDGQVIATPGHHWIDATQIAEGDSGAMVFDGRFAVGVLAGFDAARQDLAVVVPITVALATASGLAGTDLRVVMDATPLHALPEPDPTPNTAAAGGQGVPYSPAEVAEALAALGLPADGWAFLAAVLEVESAGFGFTPDRQTKILFERHIFHRKTNGRFDAEAPEVSGPDRGGYNEGGTQQQRLARARALCLAKGLSEAPALEAASWGIGQVMGFNHSTLGYQSVREMVDDFARGEAAQLRGMVRFIVTNNLASALRHQRWSDFARGYNGAGFAAHGYHTKLAIAFARAIGGQAPDVTLRQAQAALLYLGHLHGGGGVDGRDGSKTRTAIAAWRSATGRAGGNAALTAAEHAALLAQVGF